MVSEQTKLEAHLSRLQQERTSLRAQGPKGPKRKAGGGGGEDAGSVATSLKAPVAEVPKPPIVEEKTAVDIRRGIVIDNIHDFYLTDLYSTSAVARPRVDHSVYIL